MIIRASYYDSANEKVVEIPELAEDNLQNLLNTILSLHSGRGYPALELTREDISSLSLSTDGKRAYLVWINSLRESFHSVGNCPNDGEPLVFDYFGSWSEAPGGDLVTFDDAILCARKFFATGTADTERVLFEPD
jgi:hypothetical protein